MYLLEFNTWDALNQISLTEINKRNSEQWLITEKTLHLVWPVSWVGGQESRVLTKDTALRAGMGTPDLVLTFPGSAGPPGAIQLKSFHFHSLSLLFSTSQGDYEN